MEAPDEKDSVLQTPQHGGVFRHQVCLSFATHIHELSIKQIGALEKFSAGKQRTFRKLATRLRAWTREQLNRETNAWLRDCPLLTGLYQFTMTEMIRQYAEIFPTVSRMGIRVPPLVDFVFCYLGKLYEDPLVMTGGFTKLGRDRTSAIVTQRLTAAICEAMKVNYFPNYSPATSVLWNLEPQVPVLGTPAPDEVNDDDDEVAASILGEDEDAM